MKNYITTLLAGVTLFILFELNEYRIEYFKKQDAAMIQKVLDYEAIANRIKALQDENERLSSLLNMSDEKLLKLGLYGESIIANKEKNKAKRERNERELIKLYNKS